MGKDAPFVAELQARLDEMYDIINSPQTDRDSRKLILEHLVQLLSAADPKHKWKTGFKIGNGYDPYADARGLEACYMCYSTPREPDKPCDAQFFRHHSFRCDTLYLLVLRKVETLSRHYGIRKVERLESC